jgi:hypothetical protein
MCLIQVLTKKYHENINISKKVSKKKKKNIAHKIITNQRNKQTKNHMQISAKIYQLNISPLTACNGALTICDKADGKRVFSHLIKSGNGRIYNSPILVEAQSTDGFNSFGPM